MTEQQEFIQNLKGEIIFIENQKKLANLVALNSNTITLYNDLIIHLEGLIHFLENNEIPINYLNQFKNEKNQVLQFITYRDSTYNPQNESQKEELKIRLDSFTPRIKDQFNLIKFNFDFFKKLNFLKENTVMIGANGSGKTTLSNELKKYLPHSGVVISAQKVLIIPTFSGISNLNSTSQKLSESQTADKTLRTTFSTENNNNAYGILRTIGGEFQILLDNLLAERSSVRNKFCDDFDPDEKNQEVPITKLDKALKIWNMLIEHRKIECLDGININIRTSGEKVYPAYQMSDGEKTILYLIAQVLQAPSSGFVIVDEPETYLHKTILSKLWDILEKERQDCIFVYLTHDLDFATSRTTATKVWIRSFEHPNRWEIERIPENELPEPLLMELLGSRKNILFCEGQKGSIDEKVYNILFPNLTISPVESCFDVINYTKAFNKIPNKLVKAYGIIDSDYHSIERLQKIEHDNVFSISLSEIENLFLESDFLTLFSKTILKSESEVQNIRSKIIEKFNEDLELQISNYLSTKINNYFKDSDMSKGNTIEDVKRNYQNFSKDIDIDAWYNERKDLLEGFITNNNYDKIISVYNNKGLKGIVNRELGITDFKERVLKFIQFNSTSHQFLLNKFPDKLKENGL